MRNHHEPTEAALQYAAAYAAHYTGRDLRLALDLYYDVAALHPSAQEAAYSRVQIQNIVNSVVPEKELLDAQLELARARLHRASPPSAERIPVSALPL